MEKIIVYDWSYTGKFSLLLKITVPNFPVPSFS